ncbi:Biorientation of chromosomes in cell division protein 1-like 1 [Trichoplax sp. H2]|nr:Biorientation of chromosomes in cell division protein 1-like 1 [Trichoplax sp. H2]|eukprot:RDD38614.1 Biorientation of chromosomes in cell division protein 1-like 1 [Trichoplax sp. H2]
MKPNIDVTPIVTKITAFVKSEGVFDQFRRDCNGDITQMDKYRQLEHFVQEYVNDWLLNERWTESSNKNKHRNDLRQQVDRSNKVKATLDSIISLNLRSRIENFRSRIEDVVRDYINKEEERKKLLEKKEQETCSPVNSIKNLANDEVTLLSQAQYSKIQLEQTARTALFNNGSSSSIISASDQNSVAVATKSLQEGNKSNPRSQIDSNKTILKHSIEDSRMISRNSSEAIRNTIKVSTENKVLVKNTAGATKNIVSENSFRLGVQRSVENFKSAIKPCSECITPPVGNSAENANCVVENSLDKESSTMFKVTKGTPLDKDVNVSIIPSAKQIPSFVENTSRIGIDMKSDIRVLHDTYFNDDTPSNNIVEKRHSSAKVPHDLTAALVTTDKRDLVQDGYSNHVTETSHTEDMVLNLSQTSKLDKTGILVDMNIRNKAAFNCGLDGYIAQSTYSEIKNSESGSERESDNSLSGISEQISSVHTSDLSSFNDDISSISSPSLSSSNSDEEDDIITASETGRNLSVQRQNDECVNQCISNQSDAIKGNRSRKQSKITDSRTKRRTGRKRLQRLINNANVISGSQARGIITRRRSSARLDKSRK